MSEWLISQIDNEVDQCPLETVTMVTAV